MKLGVIGIGNTLMGDDGVGVVLLELLRRELLPKDVSLFDVGAGGFTLIHSLAKLDAAIIIDAVDFGGVPGEAASLRPENLRSVKDDCGLSTHGGDVLKMLELSRELGECPKDIIIYAIQPETMEPSMRLSSLIEMKLPVYARDVIEIISSVNQETTEKL